MSFNDEISGLSDYELIKYLERGLIDCATNGYFDDFEYYVEYHHFAYYEYVRQKVLKNIDFQKLLPNWIKTCRDINQFLNFIEGKFGSYQERREFIWSEFKPLLDQIEFKTSSPLDELVVFDETYIEQQWQKAIERKNSDPEGAITVARTLIESLLKHILDEQKINHNDTMELSELYKEVAKLLNLAPEQHQEGIFKQILGGANGIISGLGAMRNKLGDAHGTTKLKVKPKERHGELAVNLAGTMAIFLYKTYKETIKRG